MNSNNQCLFSLLLFTLFNSICHASSTTLDSISAGESISWNQTLTSKSGVFQLGFFKPGETLSNYYIGIWYGNIPVKTIVWVANREIPISDPTTSKLKLSENGNLVILVNDSRSPIWSTNLQFEFEFDSPMISPVMVLDDSGNLVVRSLMNSSTVILWQSFDLPTDTWLPGAKLGLNKLTHKRQVYSSWKTLDDPSPGPFSLELDQNGTKQYYIMYGGFRHWACGIWPGRVSVFGSDVLLNTYLDMVYESDEEENYFTYSVRNNASTNLTRYVMDVSGKLKQLVWLEETQKWDEVWSRPKQQCEIYAFCGEYGGCNQFSSVTCKCLHGFEPKFQQEWQSGNFSNGCVRRNLLECNQGKKDDGFQIIPNIRLPANSISSSVKSLEECESACSDRCSCSGYTFDTECLIWEENLLNIQYLSLGDILGRDLHLRLSKQDLIVNPNKRNQVINKTGTIMIALSVFFLVVFAISMMMMMINQKVKVASKEDSDSLVSFSYTELKTATKNFSEKIGEGGFGSVFKGTLANSSVIAVKILKCCGHQEKQFRTEINTIGMTHHVNLVRLRGFCVKKANRYLVYDFMPKGSLNSIIFGNQTKPLKWKTRYNIAIGIAKGLVYLHEKCRECIIHCDIKPENILLDEDENPKISDFGLAKLMGRDFSRVLTTLKGTRGYLAPEWISGVAITSKVDVFSFGMMLFEIISGKRNTGLESNDTGEFFPVQLMAKLHYNYRFDEITGLLDGKMESDCDNPEEIIRFCRVAGWCIQDDEKDRPSMGEVVKMLEGIMEVNNPPMPMFLHHIAGNIC